MGRKKKPNSPRRLQPMKGRSYALAPGEECYCWIPIAREIGSRESSHLTIGQGKAVYIHPAGRFLVVEFQGVPSDPWQEAPKVRKTLWPENCGRHTAIGMGRLLEVLKDKDKSSNRYPGPLAEPYIRRKAL